MSSKIPLTSSGLSAVRTTTDAAVDLIAFDPTSFKTYHNVQITNGAVVGAFSIDGGVTWAYMAASTTYVLEHVAGGIRGVKVKRVAGGSDVADVYGFAY